jgi:hypothetical protein
LLSPPRLLTTLDPPMDGAGDRNFCAGLDESHGCSLRSV